MSHNCEKYLVADIGATNGRFAIFTDGKIDSIKVFVNAEFQSVEALIQHYLDVTGVKAAGNKAVISIAGPVQDQSVQLTNLPWFVEAGALKSQFGFENVILINDFEAIARCIPTVGVDERVQIGPGQSVEKATIGIIGPGSGVGVSAITYCEETQTIITTEGGHATLPVVTGLEAEVVALLREQYDHVSIETVLCGRGFVRLYEAVSRIHGKIPESLSPSEVTAKGEIGTCHECVTALSLYFSLLGIVAGNLALTLDARGGIFLGGGILPRLIGSLAKSDFRKRFEAKGQFRDYLARIATMVIVHPYPGLIGAVNYARQINIRES